MQLIAQRYKVLSLFSGGTASLCCRGIEYTGAITKEEERRRKEEGKNYSNLLPSSVLPPPSFQTTQFVEKNEYRRRLLQQNHPHQKYHDDITTFNAKPGEFFVVTGGSPCQQNSEANPNRTGLEGADSGLWWEMLRIIQECQPAIVLWENPRGCRYVPPNQKLSPLGIVLWSLGASGYNAEWQSIQACDVGAPHQRDRVFVVAYRQELFSGIKLIPWWQRISRDVELIANSDGAGLQGERAYSLSTQSTFTNPVISTSRSGENQHRAPDIGQSISGACISSTTPEHPGMDDGIALRLNSTPRKGWWSADFNGHTTIARYTLKNRTERLSLLGDACTPQQAAVCWLYINYLVSLLEK